MNLTQNEQATLKLYKQLNSVTDTAKRLGVSRTTVQSCLVNIERKLGKKVRSAPTQDSDEEADVANLQVTIAEQKAQLELYNALDKLKPGKIEEYKPGKASAMPWVVLSDLHMEEVIEPDTIPGTTNSYNPDIAKARLQSVFKHGLYLAKTMGTMADVDTMGLAILGDVISGYIHPELAEGNALSPIEATLFAEEQLIAGINYILNNSKYRLLIPTCQGNHGRITEKMRVQTAAETSYEWMMYHHMAKHFKGNDRVKFQMTNGYHNYVKIWNTTIRFHHGDAIRYAGGVGGITIPVNKQIANWNTYTKADLDVLGHYHQLFDGGHFIVNGSLIGPSAYSIKIGARFERPRQAFFWIDSKMGKTMSGEVFVD